jgi:hypothetical protein
VRENCQHGSEGGEAKAFPTPISSSLTFTAVSLRYALRLAKSVHRA